MRRGLRCRVVVLAGADAALNVVGADAAECRRDAVQVQSALLPLRVAYAAILARGRAGARGATPSFQIANGRLGAAVGFAAPSRPVRWACQDFDSLNRGYACLVQSGSRLLHFQFLEISVCSFHDRHWYGLG
jgi:hypothetical protein